MGMSVAAKLVDIEKLKSNIDKNIILKDGLFSPTEFLNRVLPVVGEIYHPGKDANQLCMLVRCDYWNEYDAYFTLMDVIERYYQITNGYEIVSESVVLSSDVGAEAYEVFEEALGIEYDDVPSNPSDEE